MTPESALKQLAGKISSNKQFYPSKWDKKAINTLIEYHNNENTKTERYSVNFLKLYTMCFKIFLSQNKCLSVGQKAMHTILDKPFSFIVEDFTKKLNKLELFEWMDSKGFCFDLPAVISEENKEANLKLSEENLDLYFDYINGIWKEEDVKNKLINQAQIALNRF